MSVGFIGIVAGVLTSVSLLPQLVKIIKEKKAEDLSYFTLVILLLGLACWIWYGILREDLPIIITNSFSLLVNFSVIVVTARYKK